MRTNDPINKVNIFKTAKILYVICNTEHIISKSRTCNQEVKVIITWCTSQTKSNFFPSSHIYCISYRKHIDVRQEKTK